jgi:two-component system, chemotaxis family, chemotaxis protein CheY
MKKILIVDDSQMIRKIIAKMLIKKDCEIFEASNFSETIEQVKINKPDLIYLDIVMDTTDAGINALRNIKKEHPEIKIIMTTSLGYQTTIIKDCVDAGADEYISKPFSENEILKAYETHLKEK